MENSYDSTKWSGSTSSAPFLSSEFHVGFSTSPCGGGGGERAESLSRSHRMAEKRRRDRINSHLSALRKLVPNSDKMDKAALLATAIEQVKQLKQQATESSIFPDLPSEYDEVTVNPDGVPNSVSDSHGRKGDGILFRASFCCEDRPEVLSEIVRVLKKLQLETIHAEIVCIGGRMRNNLVLVKKVCSSEESCAALAIAIKQSLGAVLSRITSSSSTASVCRIRSKRQRWFLSSHYSK